MTNQTFLHIDLVLKCVESGVFYCPTFFRGGNALVWGSMGARELAPIPGTSLFYACSLASGADLGGGGYVPPPIPSFLNFLYQQQNIEIL